MQELIDGTWDHVPGGVFDLRLGIKGIEWIQVLPPDRVRDTAKTMAKTRGIFALVLRRNATAGTVEIRGFNDGLAESVFHAAGDLASKLSTYRFEWPGLPRRLLGGCRTNGQAIAAILERLKAMPMPLKVDRGSKGWRLTSATGRPLRASMFTGLYVDHYYPVTEETNPASVDLQKAIDAGSPAGVRRAVKAGADLRWMARLIMDPLSYAFMRRSKPKWLEVIKALVELGCPVAGPSYGRPAMLMATHQASCPRQASTSMDLIDYLLSMGVDIESRGGQGYRGGGTALHAAAWGPPAAAVVMYLVALGADVQARMDGGVLASSLLRPTPAPLGRLEEALRDFLVRVEAGGRRPTVQEVREIARIGDRCQNADLRAIEEMIEILNTSGHRTIGGAEAGTLGAPTKRLGRAGQASDAPTAAGSDGAASGAATSVRPRSRQPKNDGRGKPKQRG